MSECCFSQFPKLCMGQEMKYAVGLWEKERGDLIYHETKDSQYSGEVVMYTGSLSPLPDDKTILLLLFLRQVARISPLSPSHCLWSKRVSSC